MSVVGSLICGTTRFVKDAENQGNELRKSEIYLNYDWIDFVTWLFIVIGVGVCIYLGYYH